MSADFEIQVARLQLYASRAVTASTDKRDAILADVALLRKCDTDDELAEISQHLRKIKTYRADVEQSRKAVTGPMLKAKEAVDDVAKEHLAPVDEELSRLDILVFDYRTRETQRINRENMLRRQEQERIERERLAQEREAQRIRDEAARREREAAEAIERAKREAAEAVERANREAALAIERAKRDAEAAAQQASAQEAARIRAESKVAEDAAKAKADAEKAKAEAEAKAAEDAAKAKADAEKAKAEAEAAELERVARLNAEMDSAKVATPVLAAKVHGQTARPEIDFQVIDAAALYQVLPHAFELKERRSVIKAEILSGRISMTNCPRGLRIFETMRVVTRRESKPQQPTIDV